MAEEKKKILKVDSKDIMMFGVGGLIGGAATYFVDDYSKKVSGLSFLEKYPYLTGVVTAAIGLFLANYGAGKEKKGDIVNLGWGMFAGGLAATMETLMPELMKKV